MSMVQNPSRYVADHVKKLPHSGIRDFFDLVQGVKGVISLGIGEPDFVTPWHIREAAIYGLEHGHTSYTANLGLFRLREEISRYVEKNYKVSYNPANEILVSVGVSEAMDLALRATINRDDEFIYHEPCYVSYSPSIAMAAGHPVAAECRAETKFAVTPEALESVITEKTKALILNFPTNPTGGTMTREELVKIAEIVKKHDLLVISDEIYSELTFEGEHISIASLPGMKERTLFLHGFSKAFAMTGFRIGYACGPSEIIEAMNKIHQYSMLCASITAQEAAEEALRNGKREMENMRREYMNRRNVIVKGFNKMGLSCFMPEGAFYVFPCIKSLGMSSEDFAYELIMKKKVLVVPGEAFGEAGAGYVRCCYATDLERIKTAMGLIKEFVEEIRLQKGKK